MPYRSHPKRGGKRKQVKRTRLHTLSQDPAVCSEKSGSDAEEPCCPYCRGRQDIVEREKEIWRTVGLGVDLNLCTLHVGPEDHPENPRRLRRLWETICAHGYCHKCTLTGSRSATEEEILSVHSIEHWNHIKRMSAGSAVSSDSENQSLQPTLAPKGDLFFVPSTATAAATSLGTAVQVIETIMNPASPVKTGFALIRPPGHHACHNKAMGFCFLNNTAACAKILRKRFKLQRVLIVDFDVHHGNGIQEALYKDPNYLYVSIHRYDEGKFFPGTGGKHEIGAAAGKGYTLNIPLPSGYGDADIYACVRDLLLPATQVYKPQFILVAAGFDAVLGDPIGLGRVTPSGYKWLTRQLHRLASRYAHGRLALILEGGYDPDSLSEAALGCIDALCDDPAAPALNQTPRDDTSDGQENEPFFVERLTGLNMCVSDSVLTGLEHPAIILPEATLGAPAKYDFTSGSTASTHDVERLDPRYDLVSQLWSAGRASLERLQTNHCFSAVLPQVICSRSTYQVILEVAEIHATLPLALPLPPPQPTKVRWLRRRRQVVFIEKAGGLPDKRGFQSEELARQPSIELLFDGSQFSDAPPYRQHKKSLDCASRSSCDTVVHLVDVLGPVQSFPTVGGHENQWLQSPTTRPGYILKKTSRHEAMFYVWITTWAAQPRIRPISSDTSCQGTLDFLNCLPPPAPREDCSSFLPFLPCCCAVDIGPKAQNARNCYVEMENLLLNLRAPCIMDLKIGLRMYGDDASDEKRLRMLEKARNSTAHHYGVKVTAARAWDVNRSSLIEISRCDADKFRSFAELREAPRRDHRAVAEAFKHRLEKLRDVFRKQTIAHFYSSSLLFVYDSMPVSSVTATLCLRMIDFAHVTYNPGTPDTGYQLGLATLLTIFDEYLSACDSELFFVQSPT